MFAYFLKYLKKEYLDPLRKLSTAQEQIVIKLEQLEEKIDINKAESDANDLAIIRDILNRKMRNSLTSPSECVTLADYETVSELFNRYEKLGGNGKIHAMYKAFEKKRICKNVEE